MGDAAPDLFGNVTASAVISDCGRYRYRLERVWDPGLPLAIFLLHNPSKADARRSDPTLRKGIGFARRLGCGGVRFGNVFGFRATDSREVRRVGDPVGPENHAHILDMLTDAHTSHVIAAWGVIHPSLRHHRDTFVGWLEEALADGLHDRVWCLGRTNGGEPRHPLMLPYATELERWL